MSERTKSTDLASPLFQADTSSTYLERRDALVQFFAGRGPTGYMARLGFVEAAAALCAGRSIERVQEILDPLLDQPQGDVFWMYVSTLIAFLGRDRLGKQRQRRIRSQWRTYAPYRGDTENHWLLYYASLYLISQHRSDLRGDQWFNGKSSAENHREAQGYLLSWMNRTIKEGQGEFDSPHYLCFYVAPLALLFAFASESLMRKRAQMTIDLLLADFAAESLRGLYAGAFSRIYPLPVLERWRNGSTSLAWLLFGNVSFKPDRTNVVLNVPGYRPHGASAVLAMSGYEPPSILQEIATDRSEPYIHRERKRTRNRIRHADERRFNVYKYTYVREEYVLGSIQGGLLQPIQQHTWELQWTADNGDHERNVLFSLHPYSSSDELSMYFPEEPKRLTETVIRGEKKTYNLPNKWTGGSPYEQVVQAKDALVALYDIPEGTRFPHVSGYFSRDLDRLEDGEGEWIYAQGGDAMIAYHPLAGYEWKEESEGDWRLHSPSRKNGAVLQVAPAGAYASLEAFADAVRMLPLETGMAEVPQVSFTSLRDDQLQVTYGDRPFLNGTPINLEDWPLFDGPFLQSTEGSQRITLQHGSDRRRLDFGAGTITNLTNP